jgi:uroporphyrinogen decarboxylase
MTPRERVLAAVRRERTDRTPADYKAEPDVNRRLMQALGAGDYEALLRRLEVDVRRIEPRYVGPPEKDLGDGVFEDYWGIRSVQLPASQGSYPMHVRTPLWDATSLADLEAHAWPSPDIFDHSVLAGQVERFRDYAVVYEGADLFTRPCILRNMENVLFDMMERPEMAHYLIGRFTDFYCEDLSRAFEATDGGIDICCEFSDFGTQRGLLLSVEMFREFVRPYLQRFIDTVHAGGALFMLHSCGAVRDLIPDFIEMGVDILDPIQVAAKGMDPAGLKSDFGDRLSFHGGICTQTTLPFGTPDDVRESVRDRIATLGRGGGYILAPSHDIGADTPTENVLALYDTALRAG